MYFKVSESVVLVYEKSPQDFLDHINKFIYLIEFCCKHKPSVIVAANKTDLDPSASSEEVSEICHQKGFIYIEVSAKSSLNVHFLIEMVANECIRRRKL